ncbi:MAG TPA: imidazole glycerol phosphate synthase subunit HisH [Gemmatimonadaceae bacterium]|nr:imidazole glycerol phosphate synthase subunit HisH [Gemmatimonadaceae bacterium]
MTASSIARLLRVAIFDYGAGNLHSLAKALVAPDVAVTIEPDPRAAVASADVLVLPGVGAYGAATEAIGPHRDVMREAIAGGLPTLGICLGMQLLFEESEEGGSRGLGVIPGRVTRIDADRIPQIGWNALEEVGDPLFAGAGLTEVYYANGYACRPMQQDLVTAWSTHGRDRFPAAVRAGSAVGVQFHPEKSSTAGVRFVRAFLQQARLSRRSPGPAR